MPNLSEIYNTPSLLSSTMMDSGRVGASLRFAASLPMAFCGNLGFPRRKADGLDFEKRARSKHKGGGG